MFNFVRRASLGLLSLGALSTGFAASSGIGLVVVNGTFQLDHSSVRGTATLFDGTSTCRYTEGSNANCR